MAPTQPQQPQQQQKQQPDLILGIDPGFTGALALYSPQDRRIIDVHDMPLCTTNPSVLNNTQHERQGIDRKALADLIGPLASRIALAVVERVHASPGAGVTSMFRFGEGYGLLLGILVANGIKTITPAPSVWKCAMGLSSDKKLSFEAVVLHFGDLTLKKHCSLQKHHGRAEAMLLASLRI